MRKMFSSARSLEEFFFVGESEINASFGGCVVLVDCAEEVVPVGIYDVLCEVSEL